MRTIDEELKTGAAILEILDRRRSETGDAGLGSAIEQAVLERCLADLDWSPAEAGPATDEEFIFCRLRKRKS
jgi:hypothetical protein